MADLVQKFNDYRSKMNDKLLADNNLVIKRIFNLDTNAYAEGALDVKTKELLGLVASAVLRCDDCIKYHLETSFKEGITKINKQFSEFFSLMFGGGTASLNVSYEKKKSDTDISEGPDEEEEADAEEGIEVSVSLPHKKIRGLQMLSGGERALASIALLFAVSQVNPPPFLVLDETDAALDEANSRKYGDMIENLAKYSQLIVITHNRETMSRAGIIYGVTMGSDAISKLLSIKFDEAVQMAK